MTIPTQLSLHGYIATAPDLHFAGSGEARFHARAGIQQSRKEQDGSFTELESVYCDLIMFGNDSADSGGFQVGIRVATALDRAIVTGAKALEVTGGTATVRREAPGGWEVFEAPLPAVVAVREGINLPRYPSVPGRLRAKKREIERFVPARVPGGPELIRLIVPSESEGSAEILGTGPDAAPRVVAMLREIGAL